MRLQPCEWYCGRQTGALTDQILCWTERRNRVLIRPMQNLGLSDSTPRTESRLQSLFWPSIQTGTDVDYLGTQGYWVCTAAAVLSFLFSVVSGHAIVAAFVLLFYYFGGVGVRERSLYAAGVVLILFAEDTLASGLGVVRVLIGALLLSNLRATWIASHWKPGAEESILPPRLSETWGDKFADKLPEWLWPKVRIPYYVFSAGLLVVTTFGLLVVIIRRGS